MPSKKVTADTSGAVLWNEHKYKKGVLDGLKIDNEGAAPNLLQLIDCFATDAAKLNATDVAVAVEDLGVSGYIASGRIRWQHTVPSGENLLLGKDDVEGIEFLGKAYLVASVTDTGLVLIAQYHLE